MPRPRKCLAGGGTRSNFGGSGGVVVVGATVGVSAVDGVVIVVGLIVVVSA